MTHEIWQAVSQQVAAGGSDPIGPRKNVGAASVLRVAFATTGSGTPDVDINWYLTAKDATPVATTSGVSSGDEVKVLALHAEVILKETGAADPVTFTRAVVVGSE